jgi:hypothetical protein
MPVGSDPAGRIAVALPALSLRVAVYDPPERVMEPVANGVPAPPLRASVTVRDCAKVGLAGTGVMVRLGVTRPTLTVELPVAWRYREELAGSGTKVADTVSVPSGRVPTGMVMAAVPLFRTVVPEL